MPGTGPQVGTSDKVDPADVARDGWDVMNKGADHVVSGWRSKVEAAMARVIPDAVLAEQHRRVAAPETVRH